MSLLHLFRCSKTGYVRVLKIDAAISKCGELNYDRLRFGPGRPQMYRCSSVIPASASRRHLANSRSLSVPGHFDAASAHSSSFVRVRAAGFDMIDLSQAMHASR